MKAIKNMMLKTQIAARRAGLRNLLLASAAFAASSVTAAPLPNGAGSLTESYQDWVVACQAQANNVTSCVMRQVQSNSQTNQNVLTVELRNSAGGKVEGALLMPFGLALAKGVVLKIDEAAAGGLAFSTCLPQGCLVPLSFDGAQVAKLKTGAVLNISATGQAQAQPVELKVSLKGFPTALNRITELTK